MSALKKIEELNFENELSLWCEKAVMNTFEMLLGEKLIKIGMSSNPTDFKSYEVSGIVNLVQESYTSSNEINFLSEEIKGTMALGFDRNTIIKLMTGFFGEPVEFGDEKLVGGVGEIINIVLGLVKESCSANGIKLGMCLPVFVLGHNHNIFSSFAGQKVLIEFLCSKGPLYVELISVERGGLKR